MRTILPARRAALILLLVLAAAGLAVARLADQPDAVLPDGGRYYGALVDGLLAGPGRIEWPNSAVYVGEFERGLMAGRGRLDAPNGNSYEGEFRDGMYWGEGTLRYANGDVYSGQFVRGRPEGQGRLELADGSVYEGGFAAGAPTGRVIYTNSAGVRYEGEVRDWRFHGAGSYTDPDGGVYQGTFDDGELTGEGSYVGKDGTRYQGGFERWSYAGKGRLELPNGDVYEGGFRHGRYHGAGTLSYAEPRDGVDRETGPWRYGRPVAALDATRRNVEFALYRQPELLRQALEAVAPGEPDRIELYLLALAGDGSQEVFRREVEFVRTLFDRDYGTASRSLALVNSRNTVATLPMATVTSLARSLEAIAERMNRDEDILFLFLTSHGSREHELELDQNGMDLPGLPAAELGRLLKASGIRWKVVVVSACYSGGFIDHLKDDRTLVITAARHDRTSFGCADENEFTYFGRAFFKEALAQARSFEGAFRHAVRLIEEWEQAEELTSSQPQIHAPKAIQRQLERWRRQRAAEDAPQPALVRTAN